MKLQLGMGGLLLDLGRATLDGFEDITKEEFDEALLYTVKREGDKEVGHLNVEPPTLKLYQE